VQTARLELRRVAEEDLEALAALDALPEIRAAIDPFGEHVPEDPAALLGYERRLIGHPGFLAAIDRWSGALVGCFQFEEHDDSPAERELGYRLHPDAWGKGYATEGAGALLRDALARPDIERVYAHSLLDNPGSIAVMQRIGMTYAGPWSYRGLPGAEYEARAGSGHVPEPRAPSGLVREPQAPSGPVPEARASARGGLGPVRRP
jgi:RimJ/RimL family protein N-acetyltransferase